MNSSRRDFLKKLPLALSIPFTVGGIPIKVMAEDSTLAKLARASGDNPRVLIILQMHGGNDGLNCLIPVQAYDEYYNKRANIAIPAKNSLRKYIPLDSTLDDPKKVGLHPDMAAMKALYDSGRMAVVQGVSYKKNNGSHFRGRDIVFMGGSADDYYTDGWIGRYLQTEYAPLEYPKDFPTAEMPDPLAIEMGNDVSLIFHQSGSIPTSLSLGNPESFQELIKDLEGFDDALLADPRGIPPEYLKDSPYYNELNWILSLEDKTKDYADQLAMEYKKGDGMQGYNDYPETYPFNGPKGWIKNPLSGQLKIITRLLSGGCKTKVFMVKIGGFDTHADQVEKGDTTMGSHAALMYHVSSAMKAFQEDLKIRGLEDNVLTVTTSEFGRRVPSNGSFGTDHGSAGPLFIFGKGVQPGVHGEAFKLTNNGEGGSLEMQYDYRNVYANIMKDWMLINDNQRLDYIFPGLMTTGTTDGTQFEAMPLAQQNITGSEGFISSRFALEDCYPNPAKDKTTVQFKVNRTDQVTILLLNADGKKMKSIVNGVYEPGGHTVDADLTGLPAGHYICQMRSGFYQESKKLVIIK